MLSADPPHIKLGDFGASVDWQTRCTMDVRTACGGFTLLYAAPEQLGSSPAASAASDVYAAGLICFQMFFPHVKWAAGQPPPLPPAPSGPVEPWLSQLLRDWLHCDPARRPTSAAVLAHPFFSDTALQLERTLAGLAAAEAQARGPPRVCCICRDDVFLRDGVECAGIESHFVCHECFSGHVQELASQDGGRVDARKGEIPCPYGDGKTRCVLRMK